MFKIKNKFDDFNKKTSKAIFKICSHSLCNSSRWFSNSVKLTNKIPENRRTFQFPTLACLLLE